MKKYITAALLFCAALTAACSKETAGSADTGDTGALEMRVSATRAEADGEYDPLQRLAVRIYRASGELLRQYTAETLPSRLELLAGEYRVEVDAGEAVPASFTKRFYKGEKTFTVAAGQTTVAEVECKRQNVVAEVKFDATVSAAFGENFHAWVVAADAFDEGRPGGSHPVSIRVTDSAGAEATAISEYRLQGLLPIEKTDYDLWTNSLTLRALVLDPNVTTATFGLRVKDGEWSDAEGVRAGEGIYTATFTAQWKESVNAAGLTVHTPVAGTGVFAGNSYEARAALDGETVSSAEFQAAAGQVIPDGDMESGSLPCFGKSTSESTTFWGSGNAATSGLCAQSTKPGMGGSYCAKLESQSAFGLLAAGNLFSATFRFASLSGTASFGMPYQWTARPTALRLKYHATVGAVNKGTVTEEHEYIQDGQDRSRIFAVIVDWNSRHATVAGMGSPTGVWDPAKTAETAEGPVIAYGSLLIGETTPGDAMTTVEIPIEYYDRTTKPTGAYTLVISCTTSAYGDFKVGCLGNVMYVDDFEWVY